MLIRFRDGNNFPSPFNLFDDFFGRDLSSFFGRDLSDYFNQNPGMAMPAVNIQESDTNFQIEVAAPGLRKEDFRINVEHNMLTISAQQETRNESTPTGQSGPENQNASMVSVSGQTGDQVKQSEKNKKGESKSEGQSMTQTQSTSVQQGNRQPQRYTRREFSYSSFERSFTLPETVDPDKISANYQNGLLIVTVPKREKQQTRLSRNIEIS
jgi:HSP20 family protein